MNLGWNSQHLLQKPDKVGMGTVYCEWRPSSTEVMREHDSLCLMGKVTAQIDNSEEVPPCADAASLLLFSERTRQNKTKEQTGSAFSRVPHHRGVCFRTIMLRASWRLLPNNDTGSRQNALKRIIFSSC